MIQVRPPQFPADALQTSTEGIRRAQDRLATSAAEVARHSAETAEVASASPSETPRSAAPSPPNPGPPGGAQPADLTEAMLDQTTATRELSANAQTLRAVDQMLDELTRLGDSSARR